MRLKFTNRALTEFRAEDRQVWLQDTETKGLSLRVTPAGSKTFYFSKQHLGQNVRRRIGQYRNPLTIEAARQACLEMHTDFLNGKLDEPAKPVSITIEALARDFSKITDSRKKSGSVALEEMLLRRHILPAIGHIPVEQLSAAHLLNMMSAIADPSASRKSPTGKVLASGGTTTANRCLDVVSSMMTYAQKLELRSDNPCRLVDKFPTQPRQRFLSDGEMKALGQALERAQDRGVNLHALDAIRLLAMTGARKNEILSLRWEYIDWERSLARLPDSKTGAKGLLLAKPAISKLQSMERISDWVFPAGRGDGHLIGLQKVWNAVRKDAGLPDVRLHDLRHTFASFGVDEGLSLYIVGAALGHKRQATTQRYAHLRDDPVLRGIDKIAARVNEQIDIAD